MFQPRDFPWAAMNGVAGVYFIGYGPRVKIGVSRSIGARLRTIARYVPERLTLFGVIRNGTLADERELHSRFSQYRLEGEWFDHKGHLAAYVDHIRYGLIER